MYLIFEHRQGQVFREVMVGMDEQVGTCPDAQGWRADPAALGEHPGFLSPEAHKRRGRRAEQ